MKFSEKQVKDIVALKESLIEQIDRHQESIETLEKNITMLNSFLIDSSFTKASQLKTKVEVQKKTERWQKKRTCMTKAVTLIEIGRAHV